MNPHASITALAPLRKFVDRYGIVMVLLFAATCYALSFNPRLSGTDDATYLTLAQALASEGRFCKANLVGCPPETYYPPLFPLLLAPLVAVSPAWPANVALLMILPMGCALASLWVAWILLKAQLENRYLALGIVFALAVNYVSTWFTFVLMTETLFTLLTLGALVLLFKRETARRSTLVCVLATLLICAAALTRSVGMALWGAALAYLAWRRQGKALLWVLALGALILGPWFLRNYLIANTSPWDSYRGIFINSYLDAFFQKRWQDTTLGQAGVKDIITRIFINVAGHATESLPKLLLPTLESPRLQSVLGPVLHKTLIAILGWGMMVAVSGGLLLRLLRRNALMELYTIFYACIILLPGWYTYRNLVPILAFIYLYAVYFLMWLSQKMFPHFKRARFVLPSAFLMVSFLSNGLSMVGTNWEMGRNFRESGQPYVETDSFVEACDWIVEHTPPEARVVYGSSEKMYLCSGRQAPAALSTMPVSLNARAQGPVLDSIYREADFVVITMTDTAPVLTHSEPVGWSSTAFLHVILEQDREHFELRYQTTSVPTLRIYQVLR